LRSFAWKRALDLIVAIPVALVAVPVMLVLALAVKLDSPGPVLFRQTRLGRDRRLFPILKVRTMVHPDAGVIDQVRERVLSEGRDPRITRVGRFLRASSLDELPQVWNVLRGEMSLVGPRPVLPEQLRAVPERLQTRFNVAPGVTGLAQVRGRRSLNWLEALESDAEYARAPSLAGDLAILLRTVLVVLRREGIYGGEGENWRAYLARVESDSAAGSS
jgi:lipopolysaccharide/colanic/teichoic acid biosynthesis glycosyltransferase